MSKLAKGQQPSLSAKAAFPLFPPAWQSLAQSIADQYTDFDMFMLRNAMMDFTRENYGYLPSASEMERWMATRKYPYSKPQKPPSVLQRYGPGRYVEVPGAKRGKPKLHMGYDKPPLQLTVLPFMIAAWAIYITLKDDPSVFRPELLPDIQYPEMDVLLYQNFHYEPSFHYFKPGEVYSFPRPKETKQQPVVVITDDPRFTVKWAQLIGYQYSPGIQLAWDITHPASQRWTQLMFPYAYPTRQYVHFMIVGSYPYTDFIWWIRFAEEHYDTPSPAGSGFAITPQDALRPYRVITDSPDNELPRWDPAYFLPPFWSIIGWTLDLATERYTVGSIGTQTWNLERFSARKSALFNPTCNTYSIMAICPWNEIVPFTVDSIMILNSGNVLLEPPRPPWNP